MFDDDGCGCDDFFGCYGSVFFWLVLSATPMDLTIGVLGDGFRDSLTPKNQWIESGCSGKVCETRSWCISSSTML